VFERRDVGGEEAEEEDLSLAREEGATAPSARAGRT